MSKPAQYIVLSADADEIHIFDVGPWDIHLTVTNDAENVVKQIVKNLGMEGQKLIYIDSNGEKGELLHSEGKFVGFA